LDEHRILGKATLVGTAYLEMARAAFENYSGGTNGSRMRINDLYILAPLVVEDEEEREVRTVLEKDSESDVSSVRFSVVSRPGGAGGQWQEHARGSISHLQEENSSPFNHDLEKIEATCHKNELGEFKNDDTLTEAPVRFGLRWFNRKRLKLGNDVGLSPGLMDSALAVQVGNGNIGGAYLPFSYKSIRIKNPLPRRIYSYIRSVDKPGPQSGRGVLNFDVTIMDPAGLELVDIEGYTLLPVTGKHMNAPAAEAEAPAVSPLIEHLDPAPAIEPGEILKDALLSSEGVEVFRRILATPLPRVAVSTLDLKLRLETAVKRETAGIPTAGVEARVPMEKHSRPTLSTRYAAPSDPVQETLAEIWGSYLGIDSVGVRDDFFDLGGNSLLVMTVNQKIHRELKVEIPLAEFFSHPTIEELAAYIGSAGKSAAIEIFPVEKKEYYPLSSAQIRLYIVSEFESIHTAYNLPAAMMIEGGLDKKRFEDALQQLIHRHEPLRTSFEMAAGKPVQRVHENPDFSIVYLEKNDNDEAALPRDDAKDLIESFIRPFDLAKAPLMRVQLVRFAPQKHLVLFDIHHIITDGASTAFFWQEFFKLYNGKSLPPLTLHYKDYCQWENDYFASGALKQQEEYWLDTFSTEPPPLGLPLDFERPRVPGFEGRTIHLTIPADTVEQLDRIARENQVTMNILFLAVYTLLLSKYSGQQDIVVGSIVAGRRHPDLEKIIGLFGNYLPIRNTVEPEHTFVEFLTAAKDSILKAYDNQDYPFEQMIDVLNIPGDNARNPLFDSMLIFHNELFTRETLETGDLKFTPHSMNIRTSKIDLKLDVYMGKAGEFLCLFEYDTRLFSPDTIEKLAGHFNLLLDRIIRDSRQQISGIDIFTPEEANEIYEKQQRQALQTSGAPSIPLAVSATFTAEPVQDYIAWWGRCFGLDIEVAFAPYNQVFQELLEDSSLLSTNTGINVLLVRFEDWLRGLEPGAPDESKIKTLKREFEELKRILSAREKAVPYLVSLFPVSTHLSLGTVMMEYLAGMYDHWRTFLEGLENVYVLDFTPLGELYGIEDEHVFDPVTDNEGHLPFSNEYYAAMGTAIGRKVLAFNRQHFKVIVMDCDNTLWQGVCGEDGALGVKVGAPYRALQTFMLAKYHEGMLLTLCSKNNEEDVWEVFEKHPDMILKKEHFADWRINWQSKSDNILDLSQQLNLGLDSFIFVDDNRVECSEVMVNLPEVLTLLLPEEPHSIPLFLEHVWAFDKTRVTDEDKSRTRMYRAEKKRLDAQQESVSLDEYLAGLELKVSLNIMQPSQVARVSQLTQRTNQCNLSTIRRSEDEIRALADTPGTSCWVVDVSDRFGDYGLVGVIITQEKTESLFIDTFLLSCRVLGRRVEDAVLSALKRYCVEGEFKRLEAVFYPTAKNAPMLNFLKNKWEEEPSGSAAKGIAFVLPLENIEDDVSCIELFYRTALPKVTTEPDASTASSPSTTPVMAVSAAKSDAVEHRWETPADHAGIDRDNLLHRRHLVPLEYHTAGQLLTLPVTENKTMVLDSTDLEPARDETDVKLLDIWKDIFRVDKMGINIDFFKFGGNSLKAVTMVSKIHETFDVLLRLRHIFENTTIKKLSGLVKNSETEAYTPIKPAVPKEYYSLSPAQQRLYVLQQMDENTTGYNLPIVVGLDGELDRDRVEESFKKMLSRHSSLRTFFVLQDGEPVQKIADTVEFHVQFHDLTSPGKKAEDNVIREFIRSFDLSRPPLLRAGLIKLGEHSHLLMADVHHIVADGASTALLAREFAALYEGDSLQPLSLQYVDYAEWLNSEAGKKAIRQQQSYWLKQFSGDIGLLDLPTDFPRPAERNFAGELKFYHVDIQLSEKVKRLALDTGNTVYILLLAIYNVFLSKYTGQEDIIVGTLVAGRSTVELQHIIGMFVNTLPIRNRPTPGKTFLEFLEEVKETSIQAYENQDFPFDELVNLLDFPRDPSRNPLIDTVFVSDDFGILTSAVPDRELSQLTLKPYPFVQKQSRFDLLVGLRDINNENGILMAFEYCTAVYRQESIDTMFNHFSNIIAEVVNDPTLKLADIKMVSEEEKNRWIKEMKEKRKQIPENDETEVTRVKSDQDVTFNF
jgi:FkbH-like protein